MCDTVVVVDAQGVWLAKNSDRDPNEAQVLDWQRAREWPAGTAVRCTHLEIPQARQTRAVLLSRPFWMWGAEMGVNDAGVAIGNEAVFTTERVATTGLTGMDLLRLALERSCTAEEAVDCIVTLNAEHGQGGRMGHEHASFRYHSSFLVADPGGAFVVETAGPHHAVERVVRGVRSISNGLTIDGFAQRYAKRLYDRVGQCAVRAARSAELADGATTALDLFAVLRDHGPNGDGPRYSLLNGALSAPCAHPAGLLTSTQTTASWVSRLTPRVCTHWATATSAPCTSLFKPVRVDDPVDVGEPADRADDSLWWRHEALHRVVMTDPAVRLARYRDERDATEVAWVAEPPTSAEAFATADRLLGRWIEEQREIPAREVRPLLVRRYWATRNRRASGDRPGSPAARDRGVVG